MFYIPILTGNSFNFKYRVLYFAANMFFMKRLNLHTIYMKLLMSNLLFKKNCCLIIHSVNTYV